MRWIAELHVPHGSADGTWRVVDEDTDRDDIVAIVDPDDMRGELGESAESYARLIAAAPDLLGFVQNLRAISDDRQDEEVLAEVRGDFCKRLLAKAEGRL